MAITRSIRRGVGCILALHRVIPEDERSLFPQNRALEITPDDLRDMLVWMREREIEPIALDAIPERLARPREPKFACFTLDDGCQDGLTHALPVFREFNAPFAVNVTNGFVSRSVSVWWYLLEAVLTANWRLQFRWEDRAYDFLTDTSPARLYAYDKIAELIRGLGTRRDEFIARLADAVEVDPIECTRRISMTWDEVRQLASDPLVTIGAHTTGHHSLNHLNDAEVEIEVHEARRQLEGELGRSVRHFAYPFGGRNAVNEREFELVRRGDFTTMMTTRIANLYPENAALLDRLPRLVVSGNYPALSNLGVQESGLASVWQKTFGRLVTT